MSATYLIALCPDRNPSRACDLRPVVCVSRRAIP
jgi:hypothetical protein